MNGTHRPSYFLLGHGCFSASCAVSIIALLLMFSSIMQAQSPTPNSADGLSELLEVLHANGAINQQQYDALRQRIGPAPAAPAGPAHELVEASAPEPQATSSAKPNPNPKIITMTDKGVGVHVGAVDVTVSGEINGFYDH